MTDRPDVPTSTTSSHARHAAEYRRRHRRAQHEQAHAADDETASHDALSIDLAGVYRGQPELITTQADLDACVERLKQTGAFAYDTEFIGEMSYRPQVCLIQVATDDYIGLIDPLSGLNLEAFWLLLCDPTLAKIVHAGEQDLEHVWRAIGQIPQNVLDTQVVAGFLGLNYPASLAKLVGEFAGIKLQKGFTFTDWTLRPLSSSQLKYAADDVRFLPAIATAMRERLERVGRLGWATQECAERCAEAKPGFDPETSWQRVRGSGSLDGKPINVLRLLVTWREALAERADVPARTFLKDEILVDICKARPKSTDKLASIRHMPRPVIEHHGQEILDLVQTGLSMPAPARAEEDDAEPTLTDRFCYDCVWAMVQVLCVGQSLDPALVTSRQEAIEVYRRLSKDRDVSDARLMSGWRQEAVGERLRRMAKDHLDVTARWQDGQLKLAD